MFHVYYSDDDDEALEIRDLRTSEPVQSSLVPELKRYNQDNDPSPAGSLRRPFNKTKPFMDYNQPSTSTNGGQSLVSSISSPNFRRDPSIRSLKNYHHVMNDIQGEC